MPKLNIVWKCKTHRVHKYKNGRHAAFRLEHNGEEGRKYKVLDTELLGEANHFDVAKAICLSDLAMQVGTEHFLYRVPPTPTHEVIDDEYAGLE